MDTISISHQVRSMKNSGNGKKKITPHDDISSLRSEGIEVSTLPCREYSQILSPGAMRFVAGLSRHFATRRLALLQRRVTIQARLDSGSMPTLSAGGDPLRNGSWAITAVPHDLEDRRVEITGPAGDAKMVINALNSGANVFMADFEDAQSPTWENVLRGQRNLRHAVHGTLSYTSPEGKHYRLNPNVAVLMMRPRGWHLLEKHFLVDGNPVSASLFDFGLFFYHNAAALIAKGTGPYFYLPKLESHLEARLWNDVFLFAQHDLVMPRGTIKATVLIETILAAFEMEEILYELREHSAGLNCGRWDYIFSFIKKFHKNPYFVLPDRSQVTMDKGFLAAYVRLLIATCHKRGAHAMGGMAAQIPISHDPPANAIAIGKVRADKEREVLAGHDGTWVAHPGLVGVAKEVFSRAFAGNNQLQFIPQDLPVTGEDLLRSVKGQITEAGLRTNIDVGIQYMEAWLRGIGAVPLYHLMEDAATAEISRAQIWQWIHHNVAMDDGTTVTLEQVRRLIREEMKHIRERVGEQRYTTGSFELASTLFESLVSSEEFPDFLTLPAYEYIS